MGTIFLASGLSKLAAPAASLGYIQSAGLPLPQVALAVTIAVELGGSLLLIAGNLLNAQHDYRASSTKPLASGPPEGLQRVTTGPWTFVFKVGSGL